MPAPGVAGRDAGDNQRQTLSINLDADKQAVRSILLAMLRAKENGRPRLAEAFAEWAVHEHMLIRAAKRGQAA